MNHDYIIVGAGSAGCVMASRLSAGEDSSVLLLETGPADKEQFIQLKSTDPKQTLRP